MSLNPNGYSANYNWNYSKPDKPGYSEELVGTVVSLQEIQAREWKEGGIGVPKYWTNGDPVMNIRMGLATADGQFKTITFQKAGRKQMAGEKPSLHVSLFKLTNGDMMELLGKTIHLTTWAFNPATNQAWGRGNPRLFAVEEVENPTPYQTNVPAEYKIPELFADDGAHGGQPVAPAPSQIQVPQPQYQQAPAMYGNFYAPPTAAPQQPMQYQQPVQQFIPQPATPAQMVNPSTPMQMPQSAPMPMGMDPAIAAAMQVANAQNVQPVDYSPYDQDIPF